MDNQDEMTLMKLIAYAGNARSLCMEAMQDAFCKDFGASEDKVRRAKRSLDEAHEVHTRLLVSSANGVKLETSPILIHAQDHFMGASLTVDLIEIMIQMQREITELKEEKKHG